jgi:hypothetical protein
MRETEIIWDNYHCPDFGDGDEYDEPGEEKS